MRSPKTKGRMLNRDISDSKGFAKLSAPAAVLFCMIVPNYSPHGKINGDPGYLKGEVCPRIPYLTLANIPKYLKEIDKHTSVKWFEHDGRMWIHSVNFLTEHQQINLERVGPDLLPSYSRVGPDLLPPEVEVEVEVEREGEVKDEGTKRSIASTPGNGSGSKLKAWVNLISWDQVKGCFEGINPEMIEKWEKAYPAVDLNSQLNRADEWLKANPTKQKSNYYRFIVNWLSRAQERGGR